MAKPDGGPAFPRPVSVWPGERGSICPEADGMSLRDYAVIKFTAALLANPYMFSKEDFRVIHDGVRAGGREVTVAAALADAMIAARDKESA